MSASDSEILAVVDALAGDPLAEALVGERLDEWIGKFRRALGHGVTFAEWEAEFGGGVHNAGEHDAAMDRALADAADDEEMRALRNEHLQELLEEAGGVSAILTTAQKINHKLSITLTAGQQRAYDAVRALNSTKPQTIVIKGYAGTGKTTLLKELIAAVGPSVLLAPTGKAAARIREATDAPALTIHSWLYQPIEDPRTGETTFKLKPSALVERPQSRIVFVDEASMVTRELWRDLRLMCEVLACSIVLIGDGFQLPPVAPKGEPPFCALDVPDATEKVELTEVMRQAADNPIIRASMYFRDGRPFEGLKLLHKFGAQEVLNAAAAVFKNGGVTICHRNATRARLNADVRLRLGFDLTLVAQPNEPLLIFKNTPGIGFNGEVVQFTRWIDEPREAFEADDWRRKMKETLHYGLAELEGGTQAVLCHQQLLGATPISDWAVARGFGRRWKRTVEGREKPEVFLHAAYGYAFTAHKSQGSQWPYVLVCLENSVRLKDEEGLRWAYTAITRAEKTVAYCLGDF